jgi:hypothetical protein
LLLYVGEFACTFDIAFIFTILGIYDYTTGEVDKITLCSCAIEISASVSSSRFGETYAFFCFTTAATFGLDLSSEGFEGTGF